MSMDTKYWTAFYEANNLSKNPSPFAQFILNKQLETNTIIDIGCGNGRDSLYFIENNLSCIGIDSSKVVFPKVDNFTFLQKNFCDTDFDSLSPTYSIYSRFTWHSISDGGERDLLERLESSLNLNYLFIEARAVEDTLYGEGTKIGRHEFITDHYRRFINTNELLKKLLPNFDIKYFEKSQGFSKVGSNDPCLFRIIAKKL